jgi:hypothetical protein
MNNFDLLNAFFFFMYWVLELLKAILGIIFLPIELLVRGYNLNIFEIIPYNRQLIAYRWNRLKRFSISFKFSLVNTSPNLEIHSYDEDADEASKILTETKQSLSTRISKGLEECKKYTWVIFQSNSNGVRFIQLRTDNGYFLFDFPLTPYTLNRDYAVELIDYLHTLNFSKTKRRWFLEKTYTIDGISDELTSIQANLGRNRKFAEEFCTTIFKKIFQTNTAPEVKFG